MRAQQVIEGRRSNGAGIAWLAALVIIAPCATLVWLVSRQPGPEAQAVMSNRIIGVLLGVLVMACVVLPLLRIALDELHHARDRRPAQPPVDWAPRRGKRAESRLRVVEQRDAGKPGRRVFR